MTTKVPQARAPSAVPNLDPLFGPDAPSLPDPGPMADAMQQNPHILHAMQILADLLIDRPDTFVDTNTIVYYDPTDHNRRVQPDVYVALGVDPEAIRRRNGYLIWEVGKAPDFVLEVASESTASHDTGDKRDLYAMMGVAEYWRFDATGGNLYGAPLVVDYLQNGVYRPSPMNTTPDGAIWAYSPTLQLNLRWHEGGLELQDPVTSEVLLDRRGVRLAAEQERESLRRELAKSQEEVRLLREQVGEPDRATD